jgi:hypothetical protein
MARLALGLEPGPRRLSLESIEEEEEEEEVKVKLPL